MMGHGSNLLGSSSEDTDITNAAALRNNLPTLRELAQVVDAKPETVCRTLAQLLPPRPRKASWLSGLQGAMA